VGAEGREEWERDRVTDWLEPKRDATRLRDWGLCESENARRDSPNLSTASYRCWVTLSSSLSLSLFLSLSLSLSLFLVISSPQKCGREGLKRLRFNSRWSCASFDFVRLSSLRSSLLLLPLGFQSFASCRVYIETCL